MSGIQLNKYPPRISLKNFCTTYRRLISTKLYQEPKVINYISKICNLHLLANNKLKITEKVKRIHNSGLLLYTLQYCSNKVQFSKKMCRDVTTSRHLLLVNHRAIRLRARTAGGLDSTSTDKIR